MQAFLIGLLLMILLLPKSYKTKKCSLNVLANCVTYLILDSLISSIQIV
jgi:hypothetical protein